MPARRSSTRGGSDAVLRVQVRRRARDRPSVQDVRQAARGGVPEVRWGGAQHHERNASHDGSHAALRVEGTEVGNGTSVRCPDITCRACEHTFYEALTSEEPTPPCPKCGSTDVYERVGMPGADWSNRNYPYYDRGLGCIVRSPGHRKQICKERNLIPVDGDWDEDREIAKLEAKDEEPARSTRTTATASRTIPRSRDTGSHAIKVGSASSHHHT